MRPSNARAPMLLEAQRVNGLSLEAARALASKGAATYFVHDRPSEARRHARARVHLRSAKVTDAGNAFLCEAMIWDRSEGGLRLVLARNIGLPARFGVFEDEDGGLKTAAVVWRRGQTIGARVVRSGPPAPLSESAYRKLSGPYYALRD